MDLLSPVKVHHASHGRTHFFGLVIVLLLLQACGEAEPEKVKEPEWVLTPVTKVVEVPTDIEILSDSLVPAILYSKVDGLDSLPILEKKQRFFSALLPAILVAKHKIEQDRIRLDSLLNTKTWTIPDSLFYQELCDTYRTEDTLAISRALETHPNSIVLAQAAVESGWGNSRIFKEANNLFGIWSYRRNEPRIAASIKRGDQTIYLRKYNDISESIYDYFVTLGRSRHYSKFRRARMQTDSVELLLPHLINYSERREHYVLQLATMIRFNQLKRYDHYQLDSSYFKPVMPPAE